jgi:cytochrome c556
VISLLRFVNACMVVAALGTPTAILADADDTVDYRRHIMKTMDEQLAAIEMILEHRAPADNFDTHVQILAITTSTALKAFEPKVPGGRAKPAIWDHWADFAKRMNELAANIADLSKTPGTHGNTAQLNVNQAMRACKSCHDTYSEPLEKTK